MPTSRLADLGGGAGDAAPGHVAVDVRDEARGDNFLGGFFQQVDEVKAGIQQIKAAARRVRAITDERASQPAPWPPQFALKRARRTTRLPPR